MDVCLLKNMFAGNADAIPASLKFDTNLRTKPVAITTGNVHPTDFGKTVTTDKTQPVTQNKPTVLLSNNFRQTLGKKITTQTSLNAHAAKKKKQNQGSGALSGIMHPAGSFTVQGAQTPPMVLDKAANTKILNQPQQQVESQTPGKSARLVAGSTIPSSPQTPSLIAHAAKPITSEPDQIVSTTTKLVNKPIVTDKTTITSKVISEQKNSQELVSQMSANDSKITVAGEKPVTIDKPTVTASSGIYTSDKPVITAEPIANRDDNGESIRQTFPSSSKMTITSERPVTTDKPDLPLGTETTVSTKPVITSTFPSNPQNQQSGKESTPKTFISNNKTTASSEQSVVTNKPFVLDSAKTQLSNATFAAPLDQSSLSQQKVLIGQEIPTQAEKTTPNKADINQKDHRGGTELFELPEKNRVQVESSSVKPIAQKMNQQQTQLSASQAENRSNLASNQTSTPDMELGEQVLVGGNVQPRITEQSPVSATSAAFAKIAGNADSDASVGEQIQESIHSSLRSGNQQIVIRLNPPELGKVAIKFAEQGDDITGLLQVDKPQTRDQLQQMLPEMIQNLQNSGVGIKRLEVVLTNQQDQYALKDQSSTAGQDGWSGHQSSQNSESQRNNTTYNQWLRNVDNVMEFTEPQMHFADNSINMLV